MRDHQGRNSSPKEDQANAEDQANQVDADKDDAANEDYGEPMSIEEMIEMLKLAEDCVVLGQTQLEREKVSSIVQWMLPVPHQGNTYAF